MVFRLTSSQGKFETGLFQYLTGDSYENFLHSFGEFLVKFFSIKQKLIQNSDIPYYNYTPQTIIYLKKLFLPHCTDMQNNNRKNK